MTTLQHLKLVALAVLIGVLVYIYNYKFRKEPAE